MTSADSARNAAIFENVSQRPGGLCRQCIFVKRSDVFSLILERWSTKYLHMCTFSPVSRVNCQEVAPIRHKIVRRAAASTNMALDSHRDSSNVYSVSSYMRHYDTQLDRSKEGYWQRIDASSRKPAKGNVRPAFSLRESSAEGDAGTSHARTAQRRAAAVASVNLSRTASHTATGLPAAAVEGNGQSSGTLTGTGRRRVQDAAAARDHVGVLPHGLGPAHAMPTELFSGHPAVESRLSASDRSRMAKAAARPTAALKNSSTLVNGPDGLGPG